MSPDGEDVAFTISADNQDVWLYDLVRQSLTRFTEREGGTTAISIWTSDGAAVIYGSDVSGSFDIYKRSVDGSGTPELLIESPNPKVPGSLSPDATLVFHELTETGAERDIWTLGREGDSSPFLATEFDELAPAVSPDGRWLAYVSDQSGEDRVYLQPFPDGEAILSVPSRSGRATGPSCSSATATG